MLTVHVDLQNPDPRLIARAAAVVRSGGVVCYPADTIYGLGCDPLNRKALRRLLGLKGREAGRGLLCLVGSKAEAEALGCEIPAAFDRLAARFWPGPLTLILPAGPGLPSELTGRQHTIGVRCPDSPFLQAWLAALGGGLVSTSANRSGEQELTDPAGIRAVFGERIDLYVEAAGFRPGVASTVVDLTAGPPEVVRRGRDADAVEEALAPG